MKSRFQINPVNKIIQLQTDRLILRQWQDDDLKAFARMCADPDVMKFYPNTLTNEESNVMANKIRGLIDEQSWGLWAVELKDKDCFIGFVGLHKPHYELPITPCVEVGWRLSKEYWGKGYATEAARESLKFAFNQLELNEVYSFASVSNNKSWRVMERLGMSNTGNNFEHPDIPEGQPLREHVLYKITKAQWLSTHA